MSDKPANKPAQIIYYVETFQTKDGERSTWTRIGVAWAHEDGKGFNPHYDLMPTPAAKGKIVWRDAAEAVEAEKKAKAA
jgi:hypothetical protein